MVHVRRERFNQDEGLTWERGAVRTRIFQAQGFDIVITQKKRGQPQHSVWMYSEPGYFLFASMLNYHRTVVGDLPPVEELQHVLGNRSGFYAEGYPVEDSAVMSELNADMAECVEGIVLREGTKRPLFVGAYRGEVSYSGVKEEDKFVIASFPSQTSDIKVVTRTPERDIERPMRREVVLHPDDAMRVMKTIYFFAGDKKGLEGVYTSTQ